MMIPLSELFDLSQTAHVEIFNGLEYPWQVVPLIAEYVEYSTEHSQIDADASMATYVGKHISIGEGTVIEPGAVIHGPAIIGKNCVIRTGAYIRGNVVIGDNCIIGNSTEIKTAILFNGVQAPHFSYIGDSILGYRVHLGSGVVISNVKTPQSEITVVTLEKTYHTGLQKFGAAIGDQSEIGANAVLNPGTIIGKQSIIYPLASIRGMIPSRSIVKVLQKQDIVMKK